MGEGLSKWQGTGTIAHQCRHQPSKGWPNLAQVLKLHSRFAYARMSLEGHRRASSGVTSTAGHEEAEPHILTLELCTIAACKYISLNRNNGVQEWQHHRMPAEDRVSEGPTPHYARDVTAAPTVHIPPEWKIRSPGVRHTHVPWPFHGV